MSSNETRRQHYVPRTYLKHFATERNGNYFLKALPTEDFSEDKIHEVSVANACLQKDVYTLPGNTEEERMLIEKFYSNNYESQYDQIYHLLLDPERKTLTAEERELIISTVVTMMFRTTKLMNQHSVHIDRVLSYTFEMCKQLGQDYFMVENQKISIAGKTLEQFQKETKIENKPGQVIIQLQVALRLIELRTSRDGIFVCKLGDEFEFVTSDNPVSYYLVNQGHTSQFNPENILSLPLDNKHRLLLMPYADKDSFYRLSRKTSHGLLCRAEMLASNFDQSKNAERFMYGSDTALKNYLKTKDETEKDITDEEFAKLPIAKEMNSELEKLKQIVKVLEDIEKGKSNDPC